jgi:hypothetical protein
MRSLFVVVMISLFLPYANLMPYASAHGTLTDNPTPAVDSITATPDTVVPGGEVLIIICASSEHDIIVINSSGEDPPALGSQPLMLTPDGSFVLESAHTYPFTISAGKCHGWSTDTDFVGLVMTAGAYGFFADTNIGELLVFFDVSFFVLPESPIGAVAIIGSSLGALVFMRLKSRKNPF